MSKIGYVTKSKKCQISTCHTAISCVKSEKLPLKQIQNTLYSRQRHVSASVRVHIRADEAEFLHFERWALLELISEAGGGGMWNRLRGRWATLRILGRLVTRSQSVSVKPTVCYPRVYGRRVPDHVYKCLSVNGWTVSKLMALWVGHSWAWKVCEYEPAWQDLFRERVCT